MKRARALVPLLVAVAVVGCMADGDEEGIPAARLSGLVLQSDDLSNAWLRFESRVQTQAEAPSGRRADPRRFGRKGGWLARFRRQGTPATRGPIVIESRADVFADGDGAERELEALEQDLRARSWRPQRVAGTLGEKTVAATLVQGGGPAALRFYAVAWRERNVVASLLVNGFRRGTTLDDAVRLAGRQQRRILDAAAR